MLSILVFPTPRFGSFIILLSLTVSDGLAITLKYAKTLDKWDGKNIEEIKAFVGTSYIGGENDSDKKLVISTLEGDMLASIGDYIIKGVKGEFYPCKPDIFENTYDIVDESGPIVKVRAEVRYYEDL